MRKIMLIFVLAVFTNFSILSSASGDTSECNTSPKTSPLMRLKNHVLCGSIYSDPHVESGKNATYVNLMLIPTLSNFDEVSSNLELQSLLYMEWEDERLKWDSTLFDNITEMSISPYRIWTPELTHRGPGNAHPYGDNFIFAQCYVADTGRVSCIVETVYNIRCETDFTRWPYDRHNCTLQIATWSHSVEKITMKTKAYQPVTTGVYQDDLEWNLKVTRVSWDEKKSLYLKNTTNMVLAIDFELDRNTGSLRGQFVSPATIMMVMTVVTAYLDPLSIERLSIACSNIMVHLLSIQNLSWTLPHNGTTIPNILLFYCNSLVMAVVALLLTLALGKIETTKSRPPKWITPFIVRILKNKYGQAFMLNIFEFGDPRPAADVESEADDTNALVSSDSNSKKLVWHYVSVLLLYTSFYIYILTYFIMYIVLIVATSIKPSSTSTDI